MPKENTHLWFARSLLPEVRDPGMHGAISAGMPRYLLGSIIPDTCYYSPSPSLARISEFIHGKDGQPTNIMIRNVLDQARGPEDIVFILGYVTHCALDITFHPVIEVLSGDYYDPEPARRELSMATHRALETCIDIRIGNDLRMHRLLRPSLLRGLVFEDIVARDFGAAPLRIELTLGLQILLNRLFTSPWAYRLLSFIQNTGGLKLKAFLALFYAGVKDADACVPDPVRYRNPSTGAEMVESLTALFARARVKAMPMLEAAWGYSRGTVSGDELVRFIPGENLSTGELPARSAGA